MLPPHRRNSFSYKVINPIIRNVLDERATMNNTIQVAMPFIKATSTIDLNRIRGYENFSTSNNCWGFTLGVHAYEEDFTYENILAGAGSGQYYIGYTYTDSGEIERVYTPNINHEARYTIKLLDAGLDLVGGPNLPDPADPAFFPQVSEGAAYSYVPPPGITSAKVGRNRNGLISIAEINFSVPNLLQLEALHRTFLIPGVGMVVEWGQQFAPKFRQSFGEIRIDPGSRAFNPFPWNDRSELNYIMTRMANQQIGLDEILNKYTYPVGGQYEWMYGRVANFSVKSNSDGSYDCNVKVVGPSEDSFAYSTRNTAVPPKIGRGALEDRQDPCADVSNSVYKYFTETLPSGRSTNFKSLLQKVYNFRGRPTEENDPLYGWRDHIVYLTSKRDSESRAPRWIDPTGVPIADRTADQSPSQQSFGDTEDAYFITWRFFVNIVLNSTEYGVRSIFKNSGMTTEEINKISLLRPYTDPGVLPQFAHTGRLVDPYENFVGNNLYLRSTDLGTMFIVNEAAARDAGAYIKDILGQETARNIYGDTSQSRQALELGSDGEGPPERIALNPGDFLKSTGGILDSDGNFAPGISSLTEDKGFLSTGVWINHKAIVQTMISSETVLGGISNLLQRMNVATNNFWNLAIDPSEPSEDDPFGQLNYGIVDLNYRESSDYATNNFIQDVHIFNKFIRRKPQTSDESGVGPLEEQKGSDVIDCNIDLSLPKRLFSQIATTGLHQPVDINEEDTDHPKIIGSDERLREMFSVTSLAQTDEFDRGPDLTQLSKAERASNIQSLTCSGGEDPQAAAGTAGIGANIADVTPENAADMERRVREQINELEERLNLWKTSLRICNNLCKDDPRDEEPETEEEDAELTSKTLMELTVQEVIARQRGRGYINAAGAYQITKNTLERAVAGIPIPAGENFTAPVQDIIFDFLIGPAYSRRAIHRYISGESDDLFGAQLALAQEWAAASVPVGVVTLSSGKRVTITPGDTQTYYDREKGPDGRPLNKARKTAGETATALTTARNLWQSQGPDSARAILRSFIRSIEANVDGYNAINIILPNGSLVDPKLGSTDYKRAMSNQPYSGQGGTPGTRPALSAPTPPSYSTRRITLSSRNISDYEITRDVPGVDTPSTEERREQEETAREQARRSGLRPGEVPGPPPDDLIFECLGCGSVVDAISGLEKSIEQLKKQAEAIGGIARAAAQFPEYLAIFRYVELYPEVMVTKITNSANGIRSNAFGTAPGTLSIAADIVLPGIAGLRIGELFWVDRIPTFYRAFGAFQTISLEHSIGRDGWTTKIHARFNYLGKSWVKSMSNILARRT
jgi:hypothetical protein